MFDREKTTENLNSNMTFRGYVGKAVAGRVAGWVFYLENNASVEVELLINESVIETVYADKFRSELVKNKIHSNGMCGFEFDFDLPLNDPCLLEVRVKNSSSELGNSKQVINSGIENKILILGLAKSGTSILTYKIADALEDTRVYFEPKGHNGIKDLSFDRDRMPKKGAKNIVTKLIYAPNIITPEDIRKLSFLYEKKIWIVRDPRDTVLSSFFYRWNKSHNLKEEDFKDALKRTILKEKSPSSMQIIDMMKGFINMTNFLDGTYVKLVNILNKLPEDWIVIKYEDLVDHNVDELNTYLSININKDSTVPSKLDRVVRTKTYGNWRKWFIEKDVEKLKKSFDPILETLGYDKNDWNLDKNQILDPKDGSGYMKKIFYGL